ncbi:MAG TPA: YbaB/EbfC family nucleoid-associated protein [Nocardioidaceae bacterium]|nr:YbaB/EbfC family nucleoid-associated protein [Nocardioidaceae bacterium]
MIPEGTPDLEGLLQQAGALQAQLTSAQRDLENARVDGTSGGGLVVATVSGAGELVGLTIDPDACDPDDPETLADLIVAAVRDASTRAHAMANSQLGQIAGPLASMLPGFPGGQDAAESGDRGPE